MKFIEKGKEPEEWKSYRATPGVDFDAIPALKKALLNEQGYICCYCMSGIKQSNMKIEHYKPRGKHPNLKLDFNNLFAACKGNFCSDKHCDTKKENTELTIHPADSKNNCEQIISYKLNGQLTYPVEYQTDIEETLNLNNPVLRSNRKSTLEATAIALKKLGYSKTIVEKQISKFSNKNDVGKFSPYCNAILWLLRKKLRAN